MKLALPSRNTTVKVLTVGIVGALLLAACSSPAADSSDSAAKQTLDVTAIQDVTGPYNFVGSQMINGLKLAVEKINKDGLAGDTTFNLNIQDTTGLPASAARLMGEAVTAKAPVVFGSAISAQGLAMAPVAQRADIPIIFPQASAPGLLPGGNIYAFSVPITTYIADLVKYLKGKGVKTVSMIYNQNSPSLSDVATTLVKLYKDNGITLAENVQVESTTQDLAGPAAKLLAAKADAVVMLVIGGQNATMLNQLRNGGFTDMICGTTPMTPAGTNLAPAGENANGACWASAYSYAIDTPINKAFQKAYKAAYDGEPASFAAEAYDAMMFLAAAVATDGKITQAGIAASLKKIAAEGLKGVQGKLTFTDNSLRAGAVIAQWRDGEEEILVSNK